MRSFFLSKFEKKNKKQLIKQIQGFWIIAFKDYLREYLQDSLYLLKYLSKFSYCPYAA